MRKKDLTGTEIGILKITGFNEEENAWKCECGCGNICYYTSLQWRSNKPRSCGCLRSPNMEGKTFGELYVDKKTDKRDGNHNVYYDCICSCGNHKLVTAHDLNSNLVKSCGHLSKISSKLSGERLGKYTIENYVVDGTNVKNLTAKVSRNNTSGYKGVTWDKEKNKWMAQISFKGKHYYLGRYHDKDLAINAREIAEKKLFGNFLEWYNTEYKSKNDKLK